MNGESDLLGSDSIHADRTIIDARVETGAARHRFDDFDAILGIMGSVPFRRGGTEDRDHAAAASGGNVHDTAVTGDDKIGDREQRLEVGQ